MEDDDGELAGEQPTEHEGYMHACWVCGRRVSSANKCDGDFDGDFEGGGRWLTVSLT